MDLQADINWIQSEIAKIKDPELIHALKEMLKDRAAYSKTDNLEFFLEKSLDDLKKGYVTPHDEVKKKYGKWL